jgi:hypothetical protein
MYTATIVARGPDGISEVDAHIVARQVGWEIIGDNYVCPSPIHADLKTMSEFLVQMKQQRDLQSDSDAVLLSWWR